MNAFLERPIEGEWPYLWIDATYVKVRQNHRIVSVAVIVAVGVNTDGRREGAPIVACHDGNPCWASTSARRRPRPSGPSSCASWPGAACAGSSW